MPVEKYYRGHGRKVMADMKRRYGTEKGEEVFYATAQERGMKPKSKMPKGGAQSPKGDLGSLRQMEGAKAGGAKLFKGSKTVEASKMLR